MVNIPVCISQILFGCIPGSEVLPGVIIVYRGYAVYVAGVWIVIIRRNYLVT